MDSPLSSEQYQSSPELEMWNSFDNNVNYDLLVKTLLPLSPPLSSSHTSDSDSESSDSPAASDDSPKEETGSDDKKDDKKPAKKRKSWGQELPTPTTNLPPRKRAKTEAEKEQRRIERVLRNRAAAHSSRERKRAEQEALEKKKEQIEQENADMKARLAKIEKEYIQFQTKYKELEHHYLLAKSQLPAGFVPPSFPKSLGEKTLSSENITMADVQALSPQSLIQSPLVKSEDETSAIQTDKKTATDVLNTTQHHAVSVEQHSDGLFDSVKPDDLSSETVDALWSDWTLFDGDSSMSDPMGLALNSNSKTSNNGSLTTAATASEALPAPSLSDTYLDMSSFDLFDGLNKDEKLANVDLDFFSEAVQQSTSNLFAGITLDL